METQDQKTELLKSFAVRLRAAMSRKKGATLQCIAAHLGVAVSTVGAWSQAKNWPKVELHERLAEFLGVSVDFLIYGKSVNSASTGTAHEATAAYSDADQLRTELRQTFAAAVESAGDNTRRLAWMLEQTRQHLATPAHWLEAKSARVPLTVERSQIIRARADEMRAAAKKLPAGSDRNVLLQAADLLDEGEDYLERTRPVDQSVKTAS